jgi:iron(III) transport system ATP-binding protein
MIRIENLHLTYRTSESTFHALRGVSLSMARGEFVALLGPSGCGKTTLLRSVAGLEVPDSGQITIDNKDVFNSEKGIDASAAERNLGMVFQSYAIWPHMSVFENAVFPLRYRKTGMSRQDMRERVMHCLELVRRGALADRPAPMLSGGQQQRLALARALCANPNVLLLDEPLSNLDARLREDMRFELRAITRKSGVTTIFVTHEQNEALSMADRVVGAARFGIEGAVLVVVASRPKPDWTAGTVLDCGDRWLAVGEAVQRSLPVGLRILYPLADMPAASVFRKIVRYELPPRVE